MALFLYEFMRRALFATIFIAGTAPMLGVLLVIRRRSLMADTFSHVSLAGVALGFFLNLDPTLTITLVVVLAAMILEYLQTIHRIHSEISIAILTAGGSALVLVLMNLSGGNSTISIQSYLSGLTVTITWEQVIFLGTLFVAISILLFLFKRPTYILTFNEDTVHVDGLPVYLMSMMSNVITGVVIAVMIPIAGALSTSAIMVLLAAIGTQLGKSSNAMIATSVCVGFLGVLSGLTSSFYLDIPPGATIILVSIALFSIVNIIKRILVVFRRKNN